MLLRARSFRFPSTSTSRPRPRLKRFSAAAAENKVLVISGPTGAGKSKLALALADQLSGEIISADSIQIYRGLDVGSAKSPLSDRHSIPHHLLDLLDPAEDYSVGQFFDDSRAAAADILRRGGVPIVVGGTGLYLRWFIYGKPPVPAPSPEISAAATAAILPFQESSHWDAAVDLVEESGDPKARSLPRNDWYRLRRSLEIIMASGSPPSAFPLPCLDLASDLDFEFSCFFLSSPRLELYRAIDLRCEEMVADCQGILAEASWMLDRGLLPNTTSATRAIGYRQAMEFLLHCRELDGDCSAEDLYLFLEEFQKASRNFAKRQMTWFRSERIYQWIDASRPMEEVIGFIVDAFRAHGGKGEVPESLRMGKRAPGRHESLELKAYRPAKRILDDAENCSGVLEWIRRTQKKK